MKRPNTILYDSYNIFWREMKRYKKSRSGVLIRLIQPAVWIIVVGNTFSGTQPLIESVGFVGSYIEFMAPGVIILTAIFTSIFGGVNTLWDRRYGFMNKLLIAPVSRSSIALGKIFAISLISALQSTLVLGIALTLGVSLSLPMILPILAFVILFSLGFSGISVMVATLAKSQETFWGAMNFLGIPLFMLSPALFPLELMPQWLASAASFNPVTYAVLLMRGMMSGVYTNVPVLPALVITMGFVLSVIVASGFVFRQDTSRPF